MGSSINWGASMSEAKAFILGIDVGSVSAKIVVLCRTRDIVEKHYIRTYGRPFETVESFLRAYTARIPHNCIQGVVFTGTAGAVIAQRTGSRSENEIIAQARAVECLVPQVRTIIEMGGQDSKLIFLQPGGDGATARIKDFSMNTLCAAGTGSFLDQQAARLGLSIEEFSRLATRSKHPPRIAGRCSVFAKSDMIHLQQNATPDYDIVAGLCFAVARNFKSTIAKGFRCHPPVSFQGGVAANAGMRQAMMHVFDLAEHEFIIPRHFAFMGAIGAALLAWEHLERDYPFPDLQRCALMPVQHETRRRTAPLKAPRNQPPSVARNNPAGATLIMIPREAFMGIDVGSISTNLVVIDSHKQVLAKRYLMTAGRPLEAIKRGLREIGQEIGNGVTIRGVGTTGSGRYLTADFVGADVIKNEITAQARAAIHLDPEVDTIFEIGGQDSKYISVNNGVVVDFEMNKVCAAGTGSFLEEQAERLGISIKDEFARLALSAAEPALLGERCTVFMESDMIHHQQQGASRESLVAGLCISIVVNYLNKVVGDKRIGNRIFFQGGTAFNAGVVAAFEQVLGRSVTVPEHHEVTGALGAAILAMEQAPAGGSRFKGFELSDRAYDLTSFECAGCANSCNIKKLSINDEAPLFYGGRCEKYEHRTRKKAENTTPDLFAEREKFLEDCCAFSRQSHSDKGAIGIPRALVFHELLPFFVTFFQELGYEVVLSDHTNKKIINEGMEAAVAETCFPVKVAYGHILNLIEKGITRIFLPCIVSLPLLSCQSPASCTCPYEQTIPHTAAAAIDFRRRGITVIQPVMHLHEPPARVARGLFAVRRALGATRRQIRHALAAAYQAQERFTTACQKRGAEILAALRPDQPVMAIIGRPYNSCDTGVNLQIPQKLRDLGALAVPMDFLPVSANLSPEEWDETYWLYGQKILSAAELIKQHPALRAVYVTNFGCGPDSFIAHFFKNKLQGEPYLVLEIDEHSADTGIITRLEAFLDSLSHAPQSQHLPAAVPARAVMNIPWTKRTLYIPRMSDHAMAFAAAFAACGVTAHVMPESDEETLAWGRKLTSGRECYPCILTTGDIAKTVKSPGFNPDRAAFFMPSGRGPCRFGQYHRFHRQVLHELGYPDVPVFAPVQDETIYESFNGLGKQFSRLAWQGIVAVDLLIKLLLRTRPFEQYPGAAEAVYEEYLHKVCAAIAQRRALDAVLRESRKEFAAVAGDPVGIKPLVGIVGEIYIRSNRFSNEQLIKKVENLGGVVMLAPIGEWILYTNYTAQVLCRRHQKYYQLFKLIIKDTLQKRIERCMEKAFSDHQDNFSEPSAHEILRNAAPYLDPAFEGEAILSIGKSIDYLKRGVDGIITVMPFTCMPGTIVNAIMRRCRDDYQGFPVLNIAYDGQQEPSTGIRLETFMHQVRTHKSPRP